MKHLNRILIPFMLLSLLALLVLSGTVYEVCGREVAIVFAVFTEIYAIYLVKRLWKEYLTIKK